jgi:putative oxidoreductase
MPAMTEKSRIEWALFVLRLGVFVVMMAWTIDKLISPAHATKVFENFYFISGLGPSIMMGIGLIELVIIALFMAGLYKRFSYGFVLVVHGVSTLSSWKQYFVEPNLLFFAAWPMLAACFALYLLRDMDVKFTARMK